MRHALIAVVPLLLTGCANLVLGTDAAALVEQLARDRASGCVTVRAMIYGEAKICRTNHPDAAVLVSPDGSIAIQHR